MSNASHLRRLLAVGVSAAAMIAAAPALAQTEPNQPPAAPTGASQADRGDQPTSRPQTRGDSAGGNTIEELVVTAQKREEAIQDVPIAVSAFSQDTLEAQKIDGGPTLQQAIPNVSFSKGNFTGYNFQIRGIGAKLVAGSGDQGVGVHLNNSPLISNRLFEAEFYDVERVEVLRGPQGTLYGRNATGGVVNVITAKPSEDFNAYIRGEYGSYNTQKLKGSVNIPLGDMFALRVAGAYLKRDGYADNLVTGNDIDDRDLYAFRATLSFRPIDEIRAYVMYEHFQEQDNRARVQKQFCNKDLGPTSVGGVPVGNALLRGFLSQGCLGSNTYSPASLGTPNSSATLGGLLGNITGLITGDAYAGKVQNPDLRKIESAFDPTYYARQDFYQFGLDIDITPSLTLSSLTAYNNDALVSTADYNRVTPSQTFNPTPLTPGGFFNDPQVGRSNQFRTFDRSDAYTNQFSQEFRLQSNFAGPLNFNVGAIYVNYEADGNYYVLGNTLSAAALAQGIPVDPNATPTGQFHNYFRSYAPYELETKAVFGEIYYEFTDTLKLTAGARYTDDQKRVQNYDVSLLTPGVGYPAATNPRIQEAGFQEVTGRIGLDWKPTLGFTDDTLVYTFYSRGYKAGGLNPPQSVGLAGVATNFAPEFVDAYEIGTKNTLLNGSLILNATAFYYDYQGYQISRIINRTSVNDNIDATVKGFELESIWEPVNNLRFNATLGLLDAQVKNARLIDVLNRTQGDPTLTLVKASNASNCVANTSGVATVLAVIQGLPGAPNVPGVTGNPQALLGICSNAFAALGVTTSEGREVNLDGRDLPNTPKYTFNIGAQYTLEFGEGWDVVGRADYYRQGDSYSRVFNSESDYLDSQQNLNVSLQLNNKQMGLQVEAFVRNVTDEENITDVYLTDDSSGLFRNIFLNEPRVYGVAISKSF